MKRIKGISRWHELARKLVYAITAITVLNISPTQGFTQIYEPDGLRLPGGWNGWVNSTDMGGDFDLQLISIGTLRWHTTFQYTGESVTQEFKFVSTSFGDPWGNQWAGNSSFEINTLNDLTYGTAPGPSNNSIPVNQNMWYTVVFEDNSYQNTQAIFMETSAEPVLITSVSEPEDEVEANNPVEVSITTSDVPSAEERVYLRYSTDGWVSSATVEIIMSGVNGIAEIPGFPSGTTISYYIFSSTVEGITNDHDLYTIRLNNNEDSNYSYSIGDPTIGWANLQHPAMGSIEPENEFLVFARVYINGVTGSTAPMEGIENLNAWIGFSTTNANSTDDFETGWEWFPATYDEYDVIFGNNSQYSSDIGSEISEEGTYFYVSRFKYGEGEFVYGGFDGGFWDGENNISGVLNVEEELIAYPITFEVNNNNPYVTEVFVRGSFNDWVNVPMEFANDVWTAEFNLNPGTYQWGVADQDDEWLIDGPNLEFTIDTEGNITGVTTYIIPIPAPNYGIRDDDGQNLPTLTYWYGDLNEDITERGIDFHDRNLGIINELYIKGVAIKTWKTDDGDIISAKFSYKVWNVDNDEPETFIERSVGWTSNDNPDETNQTWAGFGDQINITEGLSIGIYHLMIFFSIEGTGIPGKTEDGPFIATFNIPPSSEAEILSFSFELQTGSAIINNEEGTVSIEVSPSAFVTTLIPTITVSPFAAIDPPSGVSQDFSDPFVYTVTAQDEFTTKDWTIYVTQATEPSSEAEILTFNIAEQTGDAIINSELATITVEVCFGTDLTNLSPSITISPLATIDPTSGIPQNFTTPVEYTVTAEDITQKVWTVTVTEAEPPIPNYGIRDDEGENLPTLTYWHSEASEDITENGEEFDGKDLGLISALFIKGASIKTWKSEGGDVTGASFQYKVWAIDSDEPEDYSLRNIGWTSNDNEEGTNQTWAYFGEEIDIVYPLSPGHYTVKIMFSIEGTGIPGITANGPFTATFEVDETLPQITFANLQWPSGGNITPESEFIVYARVHIQGLTGANAPTDGVVELSAWIGYSITDAIEIEDFTEDSWTWVPAMYNDYEDLFGENSQYSADIGSEITEEGTYYYVSRFQYGEDEFVYGGFDGGFWDGTDNVSGILTVENIIIYPIISWANLQHPASGSIEPQSEFMVYAQVYIDEYTGSEASSEGVNGLTVWIGYSNTDATTYEDFANENWTWIDATYNPYEETFGNNSQYSANIGSTIAEIGNYYYVSRFKFFEGDFVYGGFNIAGGGFWDGENNISGILTVETTPPQSIGWANLQYPDEAYIMMGHEEELIVYARVYIEDLTGSMADENGAEGLSCWIGYRETDASSANDFFEGWTWIEATYNDYNEEFGNNSQYSADIGAEIAMLEELTNYYYVSRFQYNDEGFIYGGYSDTGGGFWDGINNVSGIIHILINSIPEQDIDLKLYPNPTSGIIKIEFPYVGDVSVYDLSGKLIYLKSNAEGTATIDLSNLHSGIYFIQVKGEVKVLTSRIIKY
jgi:hypothetical protein